MAENAGPAPSSVTRLRYAKSRNPDLFEIYLSRLGVRVSIYDIVYDGKKWFVWFVPDDRGRDIKSIDLDEV